MDLRGQRADEQIDSEPLVGIADLGADIGAAIDRSGSQVRFSWP
jgi:hypothetical protein